MANWSGGVLTAAGRALQAKVEAGTPLSLTRVKLGDGTESAASIDTMTDLIGAKASMGISSVTTEDNLCTVTGIILTSNVTTGFYAREWGLFATDPDAGEILYMISLDPNPDFVPPSSAALKVSATYAMNIAISNATSIVSNIDPSGLVNTDMLYAHARTIKRNTTYSVGDVLYDQAMRSNLVLYCISAGTTAYTHKDYTSAQLGSTFTDGTATFYVLSLLDRGTDLFGSGTSEVIMADKTEEPAVGVKFEVEGGDVCFGSADFYSTSFEYDSNGDITLKA